MEEVPIEGDPVPAPQPPLISRILADDHTHHSHDHIHTDHTHPDRDDSESWDFDLGTELPDIDCMHVPPQINSFILIHPLWDLFLIPKPSSAPPKLAVVGVTHTDSSRSNSLKGVEPEVKKIVCIVKQPYVQCLTGRQATVDAVKIQLQDCSWVHLACHGQTKSHLQLYGENLEVEARRKRLFQRKTRGANKNKLVARIPPLIPPFTAFRGPVGKGGVPRFTSAYVGRPQTDLSSDFSPKKCSSAFKRIMTKMFSLNPQSDHPWKRPSRPLFNGPLEELKISRWDGHGTRSTGVVEPSQRRCPATTTDPGGSAIRGDAGDHNNLAKIKMACTINVLRYHISVLAITFPSTAQADDVQPPRHFCSPAINILSWRYQIAVRSAILSGPLSIYFRSALYGSRQPPGQIL
ncbi:hypothetical protein B0H13DRAFT_1878564 [Mycena leptocephala]|nr:hypothetical protein B0H13DRAFT_1878564 [Mycena leptocephala]